MKQIGHDRKVLVDKYLKNLKASNPELVVFNPPLETVFKDFKPSDFPSEYLYWDSGHPDYEYSVFIGTEDQKAIAIESLREEYKALDRAIMKFGLQKSRVHNAIQRLKSSK